MSKILSLHCIALVRIGWGCQVKDGFLEGKPKAYFATRPPREPFRCFFLKDPLLSNCLTWESPDPIYAADARWPSRPFLSNSMPGKPRKEAMQCLHWKHGDLPDYACATFLRNILIQLITWKTPKTSNAMFALEARWPSKACLCNNRNLWQYAFITHAMGLPKIKSAKP